MMKYPREVSLPRDNEALALELLKENDQPAMYAVVIFDTYPKLRGFCEDARKAWRFLAPKENVTKGEFTFESGARVRCYCISEEEGIGGVDKVLGIPFSILAVTREPDPSAMSRLRPWLASQAALDLRLVNSY